MFRRASILLLALAVAASTRIAEACPLCADNLANDVYGKNPTQLGRGFFWSIIFMMALPFVTVGIVAARILIARRRRTAAGPASASGAADGADAGAMGLPEASS
jgi:hypothetical protein